MGAWSAGAVANEGDVDFKRHVASICERVGRDVSAESEERMATKRAWSPFILHLCCWQRIARINVVDRLYG